MAVSYRYEEKIQSKKIGARICFRSCRESNLHKSNWIPLAYFRILKAQKPDIVNPTNMLGPSAVELCINHKSYEGHHLLDILSRKKKGQSKGKLPETLLESNRATASDQPSTPLTKKLDLLDRTFMSQENVLSQLYEQQQLLELQL